MPISLGYRVRDKISGLNGYVVGRIEWINGQTTIIVQPDHNQDTTPLPTQWFDESQLEIVWSERWLTPQATA